MRRTLHCWLTGLSLMLGAAGADADTIYDAAQAFSQAPLSFASQAINPNGVWSYGSLPSTVNSGSALTVFTEKLTIAGLLSWRRNESGTGTPGFYYNPSATVTYADSQQNLLPGELSCAPGNSSQCTLRFTAPSTGDYTVEADFQGLTFSTISKALGRGTTTDVGIFLDGSRLSLLEVRGTRSASLISFDQTLRLTAGTHLDFAVSGASDGFASDLTGMSVVITALPVPEPGMVSLFIAGLVVMAHVARRRRTT